MGKQQTDLDKLYSAVSAQFDIGEFDDFRTKMQTPEDRRKFYDAVSSEGFDLGDYAQYEQRLGGAAEVSLPGSEGTSQESGQPSGSSAEPSLVKFDTERERQFQDWYQKVSQHKGLDPDPDSPQHLYDYRAFYQQEPELANQLLTADPDAHFTDIGKLPGHPTFSNESMYFNENNKNLAGRWDGEIYIPYDPSKPVVNMDTGEELPDYNRLSPVTGPNEIVVGGGDTTVAVVPERIEMLPVEATPALSASESVKNSISNVITQLEGFDEDVRLVAGQGLRSVFGEKIANEFAAFTAVHSPGLNQVLFGGGISADISTMSAAAELDRLSEEMGETRGIIETVRSGDLPGFGAAVVDALSSLASTAVVSVPTAGAGLFVDMGAQAVSDYNKAKAEKMGVSTQELYANNEADFVVPFAIGSLGAGLEKIGLKGATKAILAKVSTPIMRKFAQIGIGSNKEGATEWIQHGLEAVNEAVGGGETDPTKLAGILSDALISEEGAEAYLKGVAATSSAAGLSQIAQKIASSAKRAEVEQASESISSIQQDLSNPDLSPASRAVLEGQMDSALTRVAEVIGEDAAAEANMTPEQYSLVASNMARLEDLQAVMNDPAVSDATKESFASEMDAISSEIDGIVQQAEAVRAEAQARQTEIDNAITSFQEANPGIEVDPLSDLTDEVVATFERVEEGLPVDPVAVQEASDWMYGKYKELSAMKQDKNRRLTIPQIESMQAQLEEDIVTLENYLSEQRNAAETEPVFTERQETAVQPETAVDEGPVSETDQQPVESAGEQQIEEGGQNAIQERETASLPMVSEAGDSQTMDTEIRQQPEAEGRAEGQTQESVDEAQQDAVAEDQQTEVRAQEVEESGEGEAVNMPPTERTNPTLKRLIRGLPNQDVTRLMGPANVEARRDVIEAITGERPTKKDAGIRNLRGVMDEYFGLEGADAAKVDAIRNWANEERTEFSSPAEAVRYQAENTDNPDDILRLYEQESAVGETTDYKSAQINEYLGEGKINLRDFNRYGDANNLDRDIVRGRIDRNNEGLNLDTAAQELSESAGIEITPDDIVDFVTSYPTKQSFQESAKTETQTILEDRYRELTGRRITPKALDRFRNREAASVTDADLIARDPNMQELGMTPQQVADRQQMETSEGLSPAEAPLPKSLLKGVSDRLKSTGLANSLKISNSEQITSDYGLQGENVNGFIDGDGNIVINSDKATVDTPIHEFSHAWEQAVERDNPALHARGMELIQGEEGNPYVEHVRKTQPGLEGNALYKEALAQAIGDSGARLVSGQQRSVIKEWLKAVWDFIATRAGISQMTPDQVSNMSLREFTDAVAVDLLSGKPYVKLDNGDIVIQSPAKSESAMTESDKFMADFMTRMKQKNGVNFQGEIDGSLSPQDFNDLIIYFRYAQDKGQINGIQDARDVAKVMGINSPAEVDMAYKLSQAQSKEATGFKKDEVSGETLKNADFAKMSDAEYRDMGRQLVDSGQVNPEELVADIIREPRALQPWEVTALQYYRSQIESQISDVQELVESGDQSAVDSFTYRVGSESITGYKGMAAQMDVINAALFDLEVAMLATANQQSAAFRLRSLMADKDFNIVTYLAEMKAAGYVDPALETRLKELSNELNNVRAKLKRKSEQAEKLAEQIAQGNINQAAKEPERRTRKIRTKKETVDAVNLVLDSLDVSSFALPGMRFQTNNTIRFQVTPDNAITAAVSDAISRMKVNVSEGNLSVPDAIEQAVADVDSAVGAGKWDSMKFRSTVANQLVQQSIPLKVKKPYVNSDGVLVVPGEYLKTLVREGNDTIDKMVNAASNELGGSFSDYDIRNAISGYGRESSGHKTDLQRKISKAKRVASLLSQVEDLETKGKRLKTAKQVHDNDTQINSLKEQIRQLEYDLEMTPEERAQLQEQRYNEQRQKYLQNYINQVQERIDNKQFAPVTHKNRFEEDAETKRLRAEAERIKNEFKKEKYRHELENRTRGQKLRSLAYDVIFNITRGLSAGADFSAIGVQGAVFSFARPRDAYRVVAGSIPGTFSEANYEQYFAEMQADPFYELARKAGLNLQLPNFYQSVQEEQFKGSLPTALLDDVIGAAAKGYAKATGKSVEVTVEYAQDKMNPFKIGDRNYSLVLSQIRLDLFKEFITNQINKKGLDTEIDNAEVKRVAEVVNTITMASKVPGVGNDKVANDIMSAIMFSARKFVATWKILGGWAPLIMGSNRNPQLFYDAYGSVIGRGLGTMFLAAAIPTAIAGLMKMGQDDDEEDPYFYNPYFLDPRHSDFLKLKMGNTRISFFQGIDGNVVFATRIATGEYMTSSSKQVRPLNGEGFNKTRLELGWDYISNKFAPTTSVAVRSLQGDRERQEAYGRFKESLYPMWLADIGEQYEDSGSVLQTGSLAVMGIFGLSYNNYGGAEFAKGEGVHKAKARSIFQKSGLSAYDPGEGQRTYFDGKDVVKASGSVYKDKYLPAYQEFMTESVISNENKLDRGIHWEVKEGLVKKLKSEAYKYAEIQTAGVYAKGNFNKFSSDGTEYRILKSQYPIKAKYIEQYMDKQAKRDRNIARRDVMRKLRKDGIKPTDSYRDMLIELYLYNNANKYANDRLINDFKRKKITLVKQSDYTSDMEEQYAIFEED